MNDKIDNYQECYVYQCVMLNSVHEKQETHELNTQQYLSLIQDYYIKLKSRRIIHENKYYRLTITLIGRNIASKYFFELRLFYLFLKLIGKDKVL
jgi:hypothetical protein